MKRLRIGISPCPNDTFAFHGLLARAVPTPGLELEFELADVEDLNRRFARGELDAAKCSFHAALHLAETSVVLPAGSALGFGVGPVLLAREAGRKLAPDARVLCPGEWTTAHLLFRAFHPAVRGIEHVVFSEILSRLRRGEADFGVCIHEARFTYAAHGLALIEDLGSTWERRTGCPLPLGGILARRDLGQDTLARLTRAIRLSIRHGLGHREETLATMRLHAQEMEDRVLWKHVELYVNDATSELGSAGRKALGELARLLPNESPALEVFDAPPDQAP
jgi:1,4-dihydroxy-6-naphthoate synthase